MLYEDNIKFFLFNYQSVVHKIYTILCSTESLLSKIQTIQQKKRQEYSIVFQHQEIKHEREIVFQRFFQDSESLGNLVRDGTVRDTVFFGYLLVAQPAQPVHENLRGQNRKPGKTFTADGHHLAAVHAGIPAV